ncbi:AI-2E family transporter [Naumannella sp. ID2617S]|uniref:AI-2E family transporter n=1 Tax=Enemella dayhoffiae TaxID=2016507 RepID=A0A255GWK1_9ACTN|nr:AI-2E family transporter [Enemella dayhoffiae]NNG18948.1 AI-2E family transporter [Naumannella sp. ID2617S]OYO19306.1 AI-2E family transporter [Enemella dayhoffiae]
MTDQPADPAPPPETSTPEPTGQHGRRGWILRLTRRARSAVEGPRRPEPEPATEPPPLVPMEETDRGFRLARMSPFAIGFFGTLGALVAVALANMLGQVQSILVLVLVSLYLALGLNPVVELMNRRGLRRGIGVFVVALFALGGIVLIGIAVLPVFTEQVTQLATNAPAYLRGLRENQQINTLDQRFGVIDKVTKFLSGENLVNNVLGGLLGAGKVVANAVFSIVVTLVLTLYFLASLPSIKDTIYRLAPASQRPRVRYLADEMFRRIGGYLSGMFVVVLCSGTCAFIFMNILGLGKYALALAVLTALFAFIPLIGTNISMILVALVAFSVLGPVQALVTIGYYLLYQQLEAYFIQPRVMKRSVDVPGAVVIVVALAGGVLLGIVGALIAIPTAAALLLLYREVLLPRLDRS